MRFGLVTSAVLHAAILAWAIFTIQGQREMRAPEPEPIIVELVNESDVTRLRQGARNAKQQEAEPKEAPKTEPAKKEAPKPTPAASAPPPPPPPPPPEEKKEEPKEVAATPPPPAPAAPPPVPAPEEQKKLDEIVKEQQRQAEEQKKVEEQKRLEEERKQAELKKKQDEARKKKLADLKKKRDEDKKREDERKRKEAEKSKFDTANIQELLNKMPDKGAPRPSVPLEEQAKNIKERRGDPSGRDQQTTASELAVIAQIVQACMANQWNRLAGGETAGQTNIRMRLRFNPDGRLAAQPEVLNAESSPYFLAAQDSAVRAVHACEPFQLPTPKYEIWKDLIFNFKPPPRS